jgi:hypothetical protein
VSWSIDDGVVPLVGEELLGGARDGHSALTLLLLPVHVEGESEGGLAKVGSLFLQLLELTFGDTCVKTERVAFRMHT